MDYAEYLQNADALILNKARRIPAKKVPLPIPKLEVYELGQQLEADEDRSLLYFTYLTGARVSEVLAVTTADFETATDGVAEQIRVRLNTCKRRDLTHGMPYRNLPLKSNSEIEQKMLALILKHKRVVEHFGFKKLYDMHRTTAWSKLGALKFVTHAVEFNPLRVTDDVEFHLFPHFLRHCRATDLVAEYGFGPFELQYFMGWSSAEPAKVYVNLDWRNSSRLLLGLNSRLLPQSSSTPQLEFRI